MLGTKIFVNDIAVQERVDRVKLPVMSGFSGGFFLTPGGAGKNYSPDNMAIPITIGTPTQKEFYQTFPTNRDYINSGLLDSSEYTVFVVCRPTKLETGMVYKPLFGNWAASINEGDAKGVGLGSAVVFSPGGGVTLVASIVPTGSAGNPSASDGKRLNVVHNGYAMDGSWRFVGYRNTNQGISFKDFTIDFAPSMTPTTAGFVKDNRFISPMLIGGGYLGPTSTPVTERAPDIALVLFYRRGLSEEEELMIYQWAQNYCARRNMRV